MLTVLTRYKVSRREVLFPVRSVEYAPVGGTDEPGLLLLMEDANGEGTQHLGMTDASDPNWRDVFVMNAAGQTVARYIL